MIRMFDISLYENLIVYISKEVELSCTPFCPNTIVRREVDFGVVFQSLFISRLQLGIDRDPVRYLLGLENVYYA